MLRYFLDSILGPPYSKIDFEGLANPNVAVKRESESDLVRRKSSTRLRFEMRSYTNCLLYATQLIWAYMGEPSCYIFETNIPLQFSDCTLKMLAIKLLYSCKQKHMFLN